MKPIHVLAGAVVLAGLASAGRAVAQVAPAANLAASSTTMGAMQMTGKILAIDVNGKILRLEAESQAGGAMPGGIKQVLDVALTDQTLITKAGEQAKPEDLKFGEQVQVDYDVEQGKNVAKAVTVQEPGAAVPTDSAAPTADSVTAPAPAASPAAEPAPALPSEGEVPSGSQ